MKAKVDKDNNDNLYNQDDVKRSISSLEQLSLPEDGFFRANSGGVLSVTSSKRAKGQKHIDFKIKDDGLLRINSDVVSTTSSKRAKGSKHIPFKIKTLQSSQVDEGEIKKWDQGNQIDESRAEIENLVDTPTNAHDSELVDKVLTQPDSPRKSIQYMVDVDDMHTLDSNVQSSMESPKIQLDTPADTYEQNKDL